MLFSLAFYLNRSFYLNFHALLTNFSVLLGFTAGFKMSLDNDNNYNNNYCTASVPEI